jgi:glucose/arabinose dehydrogenase
MSRTRVLFAVLLALTLAGGMLGTSLHVQAQEATPVVELSVTPPAEPGGTLPGNPQIQLVKVAGGLADPVNVAAPNDGSGRLFVVERVGRIRIIDQDGNLLPEPFLDLTELVQNDYLEQGLLGLAFHPDYANNGRFFVHFTDYHTNGDNFIMEFPVTDDPNVANREGGRLLLAVDQPYVNHNEIARQVAPHRCRCRGRPCVRHPGRQPLFPGQDRPVELDHRCDW